MTGYPEQKQSEILTILETRDVPNLRAAKTSVGSCCEPQTARWRRVCCRPNMLLDNPPLPEVAEPRQATAQLTSWGRVTLLLIPCLGGCDPVISIAGADFPDWLACVIFGSFLSAACHPLLRLCGLERNLRPLALFYGSLIVMFSLVTWVIFFNRS
jgi:hypothetical protein